MADMNLPSTTIIFHFSGVVACETLLWILLPVFWKWYIINHFLLLVTSFCFFNTIRNVAKHFLPTQSTAAQPPNPEPPEASQVPKNRWKVKCRKNMSCGFIYTEENTYKSWFSRSDLKQLLFREDESNTSLSQNGTTALKLSGKSRSSRGPATDS